MIKTAFVRGKYLNNYEGQNYIFDSKNIQLTGISSLNPINHDLPFPAIKLFSLSDLNLGKVGKILLNRFLGDSQILFGLEKYAKSFDIFHTADPHYYYSYQLAKLRKKCLINKLISTSWETIPFNNESVSQKKYIKYFTLKNIDLFICYTEKAKKTLIIEGIDESKISVIKLGVDIKKFKNSLQVKSNILTILFVGRLVEEKGILDLYQVFKKIKNKNLKLRIIGEGPLESYLLNSIEKDHLDKKITIEKKIYKDMPEVYQQADIFVLPSRKTKTWEEQYGMVLIEAMASGLPVIAYDTGAIRETVGKDQFLIKSNEDELIKAIGTLISDENIRLKIGRMGRIRAEKYYDCKRTAEKVKNIYEETVVTP